MNKLSAKHFMLFILGVTCISFKTYPSLFISIGGRDTWVYTILAFIIFLAFAMYLIYVVNSRSVYDINIIFTTGLSKPLGNIFLFLFSLGLFISSIEAASVEANIVKTTFFNDTPTWYIIIFFILPSLFLIGKRINTLLVFILITVASLVFNTIALAAITLKYINISYIIPIFSGNVPYELFYTSLLILGSLSAFSICLPYLKYITKEKHLKRHSFISLLFVAIVCIYSIISILSTFGPIRAANLFYPEFSQSQRVQIAGFLEFGEFFFLYQSVLGFFIKYVLCFYGVYIIYEKFISNKKYFITIYTAIVFVLSTLLSGNNYTLFRVLKYYQYINLITFIFIPLLAFITFSLRSKHK